MSDLKVWSFNRWTYVILALMVMVSCGGENSDVDLKYFDVKGFTEELIAKLENVDCRVHKDFTINHNTEKEQALIKADSTFWDQELKVFKEHDINKPVLMDAYKIRQGQTKGGQQFQEYTLADSSDQGVKYLKIMFDSLERISSLESLYQEQNFLYANRRYIKMDFNPRQPERPLSSYRVEGFHKLMFKDSVNYSIKANLDCP